MELVIRVDPSVDKQQTVPLEGGPIVENIIQCDPLLQILPIFVNRPSGCPNEGLGWNRKFTRIRVGILLHVGHRSVPLEVVHVVVVRCFQPVRRIQINIFQGLAQGTFVEGVIQDCIPVEDGGMTSVSIGQYES